MTRRVQTVLGDIEPSETGPTLLHEHLFCRLDFFAKPATGAVAMARQMALVDHDNAWWVRYHWDENNDNLRLDDEDLIISEVERFVMAGGRTIVDATTVDFGRDPGALQRLARRSRCNIVMGTGHFIAESQPSDFGEVSIDELADVMIQDLTVGAGDGGPKAGIIGELGCSWPLHPNERKVLRAAAKASRATGAAINVHPGRSEEAPAEILSILEAEGTDLARVVIGHVGRTLLSHDARLAILERGCYLAFDLFGTEISHHAYAPDVDIPNDAQRLNYIFDLAREGYGQKLLVSQDVATKIRLTKFGGHGYGHIFDNVVPLMRLKHFSEELIDDLLICNPRRVLTLP